MSEKKIVEKTEVPATVESLQADLRALGIKPGMIVLVHSSLSAMGWVCGGAVAVVVALQEVLGSAGTLVMPAHSPDLTEPSGWESPPVPKSWWPVIRENMPAYDPVLTPTRSMGIIAETFRKQRYVLRSVHPQVSFCACGPPGQSHQKLRFVIGLCYIFCVFFAGAGARLLSPSPGTFPHGTFG